MICKDLDPKTEEYTYINESPSSSDNDDEYYTREKRRADDGEHKDTGYEQEDDDDSANHDEDSANHDEKDKYNEEGTEEQEIKAYSRGSYSKHGHNSSHGPHSSHGHHSSHVRHSSHGHHSSHGQHRHHKHMPGKSYVKLPTGILVYIDKHDDQMKHWRCGSKTILLDLKPSDYEYILMKKELQDTKQSHTSSSFSKYNIKKIQRVINGCLMRKYKRRQEDIKMETNHLNERILFHGTYKVDELLTYGFDERYANIHGMFGAGAYFAKHSSKSNQYAFGYRGKCATHGNQHCMVCDRKILICRVTLGKIHKVYTERRQTAHPPPGHHSIQGVASNNPGGLKYNEYIVYRGEQAYPEYVITYTLVP